MPALPEELPGGREVAITEPDVMPAPMGDLGSTPSTEPPPAPANPGSFPMPRQNPELARASSGGCSLSADGNGSSWLGWALSLTLAGALRRRLARR